MKSIYFLLIFLVCSKVYCQKSNYINYKVDDGLPSNMVYSAYQDDEGFIWFGTDSGLVKYDGYEFTNYTVDDGLPDIEILNFFKDSFGRVWFYTLNGKIGYLKDDSVFSSKNTPDLEGLDMVGRITSIIEHDNKIIFSSIDAKIKILEGDNIIEIRTPNSRMSSLVKCQGSVYVLSRNSIYILEDNLSFTEVTTISNSFDFTYPICYKGNIYSNDRTKKGRIINFNLADGDNHTQIFNRQIFNIQLHDDQLYIFSPKEITLMVHDKEQYYETYSDLKFVSSLLIDREGNRWFTSIKSGIYFKPKTFVRSRLNKYQINTLSAGKTHLLVAYDNQYISKHNLDNEVEKAWKLSRPNTINFVDEINGKMLIGTNGSTTFGSERVIGGGISFTRRDSSRFVIGGRRYIAEGPIGRINKNVFVFPGTVRKVLTCNDSIFAGLDRGLFAFVRDSLIELESPKGILKVRINDIKLDTKGNMWLATGGNGLILRNKSGIKQISTEQGLISNNTEKLHVQDSIIWVSTPKGINKVQLINDKISITLLDKSDGLNSYKVNSIASFNDSIYMATEQGLFSVPVNINLTEPNQFNLYIHEITVDNSLYTQHEISHSAKSMSIDYRARIFRNSKSLRYQYQLIHTGDSISGNKWVDSKNHLVNFSSLDPADYSFLVRAKTKNSAWSSPLQYDFKIVPAFWQKLSFKLTAFVIVLFLISLVINRYYHSKSLKKELERAKAQSEIKALKAQINPHFLFNALNSIQSFVLAGDLESSDNYLVKYGKLIRKVLDHSDRLTVPLSDELEMLELYISLEKLRFSKPLDYKVIVSPSINEMTQKIPSMVIQPFIENAIWHGLARKDSNRKIVIEINSNKEMIEVMIKDNGIGFKNEQVSNPNHHSKGTKLVSERLSLLGSINGVSSNFNINSIANKGTTVTLTFPSNLT